MLIQGYADIAAGSVNENLLSGSQFEFLPWNAQLAFGINGDATGTDLRVDVYSGQDVLAEGLVPNSQNRIPVNPDDFNLSDVAAAGDRLKIRVRNIGAATRRVFYSVNLQPVS